MKTTLFAVAAISTIIVALLLESPLKADVVILQNGGFLIGQVISQDEDGVQFRTDANSGNVHYPVSMVKDVVKQEFKSTTNRIPSWVNILSRLATNEWAHDIKQIPATVIYNGSLQDVPYISFRCNTAGYEINIYGDLDNPACVEIGAITYSVKNNEAKTNCMNFIASVLTSANDKEAVQSLNLNQKDLEKKEGMTFETTFPDEPDAYGGWWISIYDENALTNARASGAELLSIKQPRIIPKPQSTVVISQPIVTTPDPAYTWSSDELSYSRPSRSAGGEVYVRGYYRKDGTYVSPYTRSAPHKR